jgi:hypothetical protein
MHYKVGSFGVICIEMDGVIVLSIHARVHHKNTGFNDGAFAGFEDHRTDGQIGGSASLQDFDVWILFETQRTSTGVGHFDLE